MSLGKGDHLRIQRNGRVIEPNEEAYHEFEVLGSLDKDGNVTDYITYQSATPDPNEGEPYQYHDIRIKIIK